MLSLLKLIGRLIFKVIFSLEYYGVENVPEQGPVIIAGNHPSYLDPVLIALPIERSIRFMAWDRLFSIPLLGNTIRSLGAFPVDITRGKGESAFLEARRVLTSGEALGIFPEGQRSERGPMGDLRRGVARLAIDTGAPIVPVTIGGASRAWPKWRLLPKPAKIVVRYHEPVRLEESERRSRAEDRVYHREVMETVAASINRTLSAALRGGEGLERWYRRPPSHVRTYEWVPLAAAIVASLVLYRRGTFLQLWKAVWLVPLAYYLYLISDLLLIKPSRTAKWLRNSMPVWLIFAWHYPLVGATGLPSGRLDGLLAAAILLAFFPFFWEDYYTLQKFVRGIVVTYYASLALLLRWPESLGTFTAVLVFIALFCFWYRTRLWKVSVSGSLLLVVFAIACTGSLNKAVTVFLLLPFAVLASLYTFVGAAYDIRKAGEVDKPT